ncbi:MAG: transglutaminase domain-containing protein [Planctomycetota bacterium]|jgi:transglutaminase-like putative cysteine protease/sugar lactone lactonase YvrE
MFNATCKRLAIALTPWASAVCMAVSAHAAPGDVTATIEAPCKYPSGLASDGTHLYLADWREARIFQIDPAGGSVTRTWPAPSLNPHGLTFGEGRLWISDDHTGGIFALDLDTGVVDTLFAAPDERAYGLAYGDGVLFVLARDKVYRVTTDDGTILGSFAAPARGARCLAFDGRYLWISNRLDDELYLVDPETGWVISILPSPGPYPGGVAWHGDQLWNVDFQDRALRRISVRDEPHYMLADPRHARVEHLWALSNYGPGDVLDLRLSVALPTDLEHQELLSQPTFSRVPHAIETDQWGQRCAVFDLGRVAAGEKIDVSYTVDVELSVINHVIFPDTVGTLDDIPAALRSQYTADSTRYNYGSPFMQKTVEQVVGDETNPYRIARKIYAHIIDRLKYQMIGGWDIPEVVLERGSGSCSEYTYTFIALCRAAGLPARYQGSISMRGDDASIDEAFHRWAQVYLPAYGWIPVDANRGDKPGPADQARGFGTLKNSLLITTHGGGGSEYLKWGYNAHATYKTTGFCKIDETHFGFWEPLETEGEGEPEAGDEKGTTARRAGDPPPRSTGGM